MEPALEDFVHVFRPPSTAGAPVFLLLHGTGGNEHDLVPLADMLLPDAGVLSPRGKVLERGMPRFFRRLAEGVFDEEDLRRRATELARFAGAARAHYGVADRQLIAVGFSNGANIAAALLVLHPGVLDAAVLFRAMVPLVPETAPSLGGTRVLMANGRRDPMIPAAEADRLAAMLESAGASVTRHWESGGHELTAADVQAAKQWLARPRTA
jgi:predicted esterase